MQVVGQMIKSASNEEICPGKLGMVAVYELVAHVSWVET